MVAAVTRNTDTPAAGAELLRPPAEAELEPETDTAAAGEDGANPESSFVLADWTCEPRLSSGKRP